MFQSLWGYVWWLGKRKKGKLSLKGTVLDLKLKDPGSIPGLSMTTFLTLDGLVNFFHLFHRSVVKIVSTEKKCTTWELWVKFYLGQNEDYSPGDSISDSSEKQLQRGRWEGQYICDFCERGVHAIKHTFLQKVAATVVKITASHEEQRSPWRILVLF